MKTRVILTTFIRTDTTVNHKRPVNLDLGSMTFPPMAIASILHRLSGIVLFLLLPIMMLFFSQSLCSETSFDRLIVTLHNPFYKLLLWAFSTALMYHIIAGIRHIIMDFGVGEQLTVARRSAVCVIVIAIIVTIALGVWIW